MADGSWGRYHGPNCQRLSEALAELHEGRQAALCCSGTVAVELALRGVGVTAGDEVLLAGYDFGGNFRAIEAIGAVPVLVDVRANDWQLDVRLLPDACSPKTKAILATHLHGGVVDMPAVMELARARGLAVVEDACQCPGALVAGRRAGTWGDAGVLSFGGSKLLSAGRGGATLTGRAVVGQRIKLFCERGNNAFPLSELQAAVLVPQLALLDERNARRATAALRLLKRLEGVACLRPLVSHVQQSQPGYYKLGFQLLAENLGADGPDRDLFAAAVRAEGVALDAGFRDFSRRSASRCRVVGDLPHSRQAGAVALVLHHPVLLAPDDTIDLTAAAIVKVANGWAR